jgi:hypothetical protein
VPLLYEVMLASLILVSALNPVVTVDVTAVTVESVLERAAPAGVRLVADGPIGTDLIAIRADKVPLPTFMAKVAEATLGAWSTIEGGFRLTRDGGKWSQSEKQERARRLEAVSEAIAKAIEPTTKEPEFTPEIARKLGEKLREASSKLSANPQTAEIDWAGLQGRSPGDRMMARVLMAVDPAELAAMVDGERRVWSSRPNRLQRSLGPGGNTALAKFLAESRVWQAHKPQSLEVDALGSFGIAGHWATGPIQPTRILLIANAWTTHGFFNFELKLLDDAGREVTGTSAAISIGTSPRKEDKAPATTQGEPTLTYSKSTLVLRALKSRSAQETPADIRPALLNIENGDPYHQAGREIVQLIAGDRPFIAVFNDLMIPAYDMITPNSTAGTVKWMLGRTGQTAVTESDGWLVAAPTNPVSGKAMTLDRAKFAEMLREMDRQGGPGLNHLVALSRTAACHSPALLPWMRALFPETATQQNLSNWEVVRLYDALLPSLSPAEEQTHVVGRLPESARGRLAHMMFYTIDGTMTLGLQAQTEEGVDPTQDVIMTGEPTEVWPNGVPADLRLSLVRKSGQVLAGIGSDLDPFEPSELGAQLAMRERPDIFPWMSEMPLPAQFHVLNRELVTIQFALKPDSWLATYNLSKLTKTDTRSYSVGTLPPEIFKIVEAARVESRKTYSGIGIPPKGGGNIPPLKTP